MTDRAEPFRIAGRAIAPGERSVITLPVSHQVTGLEAGLALEVLQGLRPGPTVFVSAAIHGDEINGTAIVQQLVRRLDPARLSGTLMLVPAVNIYGFISHSRYLPDRRDLNRSFPGSERGSLAAQLADVFLTHVIEPADLGIDLHTAAIHRFNLPQIRIAAEDPYLVELAKAFGAPVVIESPLRAGSMRALAAHRGTPMLLLEAGEALRFDKYSIEIGTEGVLRVLAKVGLIAQEDAPAAVEATIRSRSSRWIRAPRGGVMRRARASGDLVREGEVLAFVGGLFGEDEVELISPLNGIVIGHAVLPVVNQGDALFHIAEFAEFDHSDPELDAVIKSIDVIEAPFEYTPMLDEDEVL